MQFSNPAVLPTPVTLVFPLPTILQERHSNARWEKLEIGTYDQSLFRSPARPRFVPDFRAKALRCLSRSEVGRHYLPDHMSALRRANAARLRRRRWAVPKLHHQSRPMDAR